MDLLRTIIRLPCQIQMIGGLELHERLRHIAARYQNRRTRASASSRRAATVRSRMGTSPGHVGARWGLLLQFRAVRGVQTEAVAYRLYRGSLASQAGGA